MRMGEDSKQLSDVMKGKMEQYRKQLLDVGMMVPTKRAFSRGHWFFYKPVTALTDFIVNLRGNDDHIEVIYGYTSTAFMRMAGEENALLEWGVSDEDITIREKVIICSEADEKTAKAQIKEMYRRYATVEKDELLGYAKAKRKEFIQQITVRLKPLGFKKQANTWTRLLETDYYVMFNAQKSSFSDEYYFNVYIGKNGINNHEHCYRTRVAHDGMCLIDWQTLRKDEFDSFLEHTVVSALEQIVNTPLQELGKLQSVWSCCSCNRQKCERCWVERNLWESKAILYQEGDKHEPPTA